MTRKNALKRLTRDRMKQSGESYAQARRGVDNRYALNRLLSDLLAHPTFQSKPGSDAVRGRGVVEVRYPTNSVKYPDELRAAIKAGTGPMLRAMAEHGSEFFRYARDPKFLSHWTCPRCRHPDGLAVGDDSPHCDHCKYVATPKVAADDFIRNVLLISQEREDPGFEWPRYKCPDCESDALVDKGPMGGVTPEIEFLCFSCGRDWSDAELRFCDECTLPRHHSGMQAICDSCLTRKLEAEE